MKDRYLEVTFRNGKPFAAYLYIDRRPGDRSVRSEEGRDGYVVDFAPDGRVIGIEITAPACFTVAGLNALLSELNLPPIAPAEVGPLAA